VPKRRSKTIRSAMFSALLKIFGLLSVVFGSSMLPPALVSVIDADGHHLFFLVTGAVGIVLGVIAMVVRPAAEPVLRTRDGFLVVALAWFSVSLFGAIPFVVVGGFDLVTAIFESASGFTTTGSTAIVGLDDLPRSLLLFRQQTQWLGGIGVVVAAIALLPILGTGGMQLMKAETTGPAKSDKLHPRIKHTAQALWRLYLGFTVACALAYWFAGMPVFDAIAHSFTTVSTGGYSIYDASIGHYNSASIELVAIVFMMLGAINYAVHFRALTKLSARPYFENAEARSFAFTVLILIALTAGVLSLAGGTAPGNALRLAAFQVVSVITSTGYGIDDFSVWPSLLPVMLIFVCFIGGCAGSTAGGMKVIRFLVMSKQAVIEVTRLIHPRLVRPLKIGNGIVDDGVVRAVWSFFTVYLFVFVILMLSLMWLGLDQVTAFAAVATCLNNLGPGLGDVASNFASVSDPVKLICAFACILGRLEVLTIFVLFTPGYWRR
jgi:trk system potassium uptake protein